VATVVIGASDGPLEPLVGSAPEHSSAERGSWFSVAVSVGGVEDVRGLLSRGLAVPRVPSLLVGLFGLCVVFVAALALEALELLDAAA
jgi:hypothetical protein